MPKHPTRQPDRRDQGKTPEPPTRDKKKSKKPAILTAAGIFAVIAAVVIVFYGMVYWLPFQRTIIKVEDDSVRINYFLRRLLMSSTDTDVFSVMEAVVQELIIKQEAPSMGITATKEEVDTFLRDIARRDAETITDAEFNEWYRQQLNGSQLSNKDFRELVSRAVLRQKLAELLASRVSTVGEQIRLHAIIVNTYDEAVKVKERADAGEDFKILAKEVSLDTTTKDNGGEVGWLPPGVLDTRYRSVIEALAVGVASEPVMNSDPNADPSTTTQTYALFMISEKSVSMDIAEEQLSALRSRALQDWINEQMQVKSIEFHGLTSGRGFDSETNAWLIFQMQRLRRVSESSTGSSTDTSTSSQGSQQP